METKFSFIILLGVGAVLLRPRDVPIMARVAGRVAGMSIRALRNSKEVAEKAIKRSAELARDQNPEMAAVRNNLKQSLSQIDSLSTAVRRDIAGVPLDPASIIRKGWRSLEGVAGIDSKSRQDPELKISPKASINSDSASNSPASNNIGASLHRESVPLSQNTNTSNGSDFIARCIEEAALGQMQNNMFEQPLSSSDATTSEREPDREK